MNITSDTTVAAVAIEHPLATRVFARHGIDFCCGGGESLVAICRAKGMETEALMTEIEAEISGSCDAEQRWDEAPLPDLIDHILRAHHEPLREELPRLEAMVRKVHQRHGPKNQEAFDGLLATFMTIKTEIEQHLLKEEMVLFPAIKAGQTGMLEESISVIETEHDTLAGFLRELRGYASNYVVPEDACNTLRALWVGLGTLEQNLREHTHLENNILHKRAM
ncbi:MAG: iron-sulfur cluster repair di-iron protein [Planctomycetes bacterium]|jgi:regulator of cell morphogenesis and NO signaling|nr:iron-sulfur cluster repair di-iron protein [Planctomycetota bacterium]